jgi:hypothetical protein
MPSARRLYENSLPPTSSGCAKNLKFSQPVFALHLHTTASTVRKWEQGDTHPAGPALKLLNVIAEQGPAGHPLI